jgi:hypothetical protein
VGANIVTGLATLHSSNATKYPILTATATATPPTTTVLSTFYDLNYFNPGWQTKITYFGDYVANGWNSTKVDVSMHKFCYVDYAADWTVYRDAILALEAQYPNTVFVYWTMPYMIGGYGNEAERDTFNKNLRDWIATQNNKLLFDIADIEAWSPSGEHQTFTSNGNVYEVLSSAYTSDGGHLNAMGSERMAIGLYSLFGKAMNLMQTSS